MTNWSEADTKKMGEGIIFWPNFWHCKHQNLQWPKMYSIEYILFPITKIPLGTLIFLSEIDPVGILLLDSMILYTITVREIQGGEGSLSALNRAKRWPIHFKPCKNLNSFYLVPTWVNSTKFVQTPLSVLSLHIQLIYFEIEVAYTVRSNRPISVP